MDESALRDCKKVEPVFLTDLPGVDVGHHFASGNGIDPRIAKATVCQLRQLLRWMNVVSLKPKVMYGIIQHGVWLTQSLFVSWIALTNLSDFLEASPHI